MAYQIVTLRDSLRGQEHAIVEFNTENAMRLYVATCLSYYIMDSDYNVVCGEKNVKIFDADGLYREFQYGYIEVEG